jgi:hypothetical protein
MFMTSGPGRANCYLDPVVGTDITLKEIDISRDIREESSSQNAKTLQLMTIPRRRGGAWRKIVGRAFEMTLHRKQEVELKMHAAAMGLFRVIPGLEIAPGLLDFSSASALIAAGYEQTRAALGASPLPEGDRRETGEKGAHPHQPRELRA